MGANRSKTLKIIIACALVAVVAVPIISCCTGIIKLYGNDRSMTEYRSAAEAQDAYYYKTDGCAGFSEFVRIDKTTGGITVRQLEDIYPNGYGETPFEPYESVTTDYEEWTADNGKNYYAPAAPVVLDGNDFPHRMPYVAKSGYTLLQKITDGHNPQNKLRIQYHATLIGGEVYGFCNVYSGCVGFFAGGGNIGVEKILYTSFFRYDPQYDGLTELLRVEGGNAVAYDCDTLFFYKDQKYYSQNLGEEAEFICKDLAFDSGFTSYSYCQYFFDSERLVICQKKRYSDDNKDFNYIIVCNMDGKKLSEHKTEHTVTALAIAKGS